MKIDKIGIDLIKKFEGCSLKPYRCPAGIPTIGFGSTYHIDGSKVRMTDKPISEKEAEELLKDTLVQFEEGVSKMVTSKITQNQFNALVSFAYNLGLGSLRGSTLLKKVNINPNDPTIKNEFLKWVFTGKKQLKGLILRRTEESNIYYKV